VLAYASPTRVGELHKPQYPEFWSLSNPGHGIDFQREFRDVNRGHLHVHWPMQLYNHQMHNAIYILYVFNNNKIVIFKLTVGPITIPSSTTILTSATSISISFIGTAVGSIDCL
jgi:hypothetical protein